MDRSGLASPSCTAGLALVLLILASGCSSEPVRLEAQPATRVDRARSDREVLAAPAANPEDTRGFTDELLGRLRDGRLTPDASVPAIYALRSRADAVPGLIDLLASGESPLARRRALWTLQGMGSVGMEPIQARLARDPDPSVRADAARSLAVMQVPAVTLLRAAADSDPSPGVRFAAVEALAELGQPATVTLDLLVGLLASEDLAADQRLRVRLLALDLLEGYALTWDRAAQDALLRLMDGTQDGRLHQRAAELLAGAGRSVLACLRDALTPPPRPAGAIPAEAIPAGATGAFEGSERALRAVAEVVERVGPRAYTVAPALRARLRAGCSPQARVGGARALGSIGLTYGVLTRELLHEEARRGNSGAVEALARCGEAADLAQLAATLRRDPRSGPNPSRGPLEAFLLQVARVRLKGLSDGAACEVVRAGLGSDDPAVREAACRVLAWWPTDLLRPFAHRDLRVTLWAQGLGHGDTSPTLRRAALRALTRWGYPAPAFLERPRDWVTELHPLSR